MRTWLTGWERIANYLDVSVKAAQRWDEIFDMPVMRSPTKKPMAKSEQLDLWLKKFKDKINGK